MPGIPMRETARRPRSLAAFVVGTCVFASLVASAPKVARADDDGTGDPAASGDEQAVAVTADEYADTDPSALTDFSPALDPHGAWVDDPTYGTVWMPNADEVGADFSPYASAGHWSYDNDYEWVSDYDWGWAVFHYGRWVRLRDRGWSWIPGRLYSDAWVVWRVGDDASAFVGWAPAPPVWGWRGGVAGLLGFVPQEPYVFCPPRELFAPDIAPRIVGGERAAVLTSETRPYVMASPSVGPSRGPRVTVGPPPSMLGIEPGRVSHVAQADLALTRARHFARPSTALPMGARAPVPHVVRPRLVARPIQRAGGVVGRPPPSPARRK
jgi:hypothetical protein